MQTGYTCPVLDSVTPSRGTADGGTSVNVLSSYLLDGQVISASDVSCEFVGVTTVQAQSVTYNSVTCLTPAISPSKFSFGGNSLVTDSDQKQTEQWK